MKKSFARKTIKTAAAATLALTLLSGCAVQDITHGIISDTPQEQTTEPPEGQTAEPAQTTGGISQPLAGGRPFLIKNTVKREEPTVTPSTEPYTIEPGLSNIDNLWQFYFDERKAQMLSQNGFVIDGSSGAEFFEIYETNRYGQIPNFITVDSMMHTYHLYFSYLLKNIEKDYLIDSLTRLSEQMLEITRTQYSQLKGSEWEDAAKRNAAFFGVGCRLLGSDVPAEGSVDETIQSELGRIGQAEEIAYSLITQEMEDYTQYIPRGYYEGDAKLEQYFKAMMWYGRIHFTQESEEMDKSALLITKALKENDEAYKLWESVYAVTAFFAGASDDLGVCEYAPAMQEAYGGSPSADDLIGNGAAFDAFHKLTAKLPKPRINSIPIWEDEENVIPGFRFMGQRFTIDAAIMQQLLYSNVGQNSQGDKRMLPDVLDVPAALGSDTALGILEENGAAGYAGYSENMEKLRESLSAENETLWSASLYASWLDTLRPLLTVKGEGYPIFMQNEEWTKKDLECFAGSFTELKHDTVLYAKQVIAEMGGGWSEEPDDRGYVEPEPAVYARFANLADATAQGLKEYGMLKDSDGENLTRLSEIASRLLAISDKELRDEVLTDEEYEFIKGYGGTIEHFWYEAVKGEREDSEYIASREYPAAVVVDIATNPDAGTVLEAATGNPSTIYVVVKVDGKLKIATGSTYTFYQFTYPASDRMTDEAWRLMMGIQPDDDYNYDYDSGIDQPAWTSSYRYVWQE